MNSKDRLEKLKIIFSNILFTEARGRIFMQISIDNSIIFIIPIKPLLDDKIDVYHKNWEKHGEFYLYNSRITVVKIKTIENIKENLKNEITILNKRYKIPICDKIVQFLDNYRTTKNGCVFINEQYVHQIDEIQSSVSGYTERVDRKLCDITCACDRKYYCKCCQNSSDTDKYESFKYDFGEIYQIQEDISIIFHEINNVMIPSFHQYCGNFWKIFKETFSHENHIMIDSLCEHESEAERLPTKYNPMKFHALALLNSISDYSDDYMRYLETIRFRYY